MREQSLNITIKTLSNTAVDIIRINGFENAKKEIEKLNETCELLIKTYDLDQSLCGLFAQSVLNKLLYDSEYIISWNL